MVNEYMIIPKNDKAMNKIKQKIKFKEDEYGPLGAISVIAKTRKDVQVNWENKKLINIPEGTTMLCVRCEDSYFNYPTIKRHINKVINVNNFLYDKNYKNIDSYSNVFKDYNLNGTERVYVGEGEEIDNLEVLKDLLKDNYSGSSYNEKYSEICQKGRTFINDK